MAEEEVPVYERLMPKECLIISKTSKDIYVVCNEDGEITFKRVPLSKEPSEE